MKPIPVIDPRITGLVPERHAARVVTEMCYWLLAEHARLTNETCAAIRRGRGHFGNPKAQQRLINRMRKASGNSVLDIHLYPGKRGRFAYTEVDWITFDPHRNCVMNFGDPMPERPWLICRRMDFFFDPKREDMEPRYRRIFFITHHAAMRLAMRCGARTPDDLIKAMKEVWLTMKQRVDEADEATGGGDDKAITKRVNWNSVPVAGGTGVFEFSEKYDGLVMTTVLEAGMAIKAGTMA